MKELVLQLTEKDYSLMRKVAEFEETTLEELALHGLKSNCNLTLEDTTAWALCGLAEWPRNGID